MPEEAGGWLAYSKEKEEKKEEPKEEEKVEEKKEEPTEETKAEEEKKKEKKKDYGTPLVIHSLQNGSETELLNVMDYRFTKNGKFLFYTVSSEETPESDGLYRIVPGETAGAALLTGKGNYKRWAFDEEETVLAFLTDRDDYEADEPTFNLYGMDTDDAEATLWISHTSTKGFPEGMAVSDKSGLSFTEDGKIV